MSEPDDAKRLVPDCTNLALDKLSDVSTLQLDNLTEYEVSLDEVAMQSIDNMTLRYSVNFTDLRHVPKLTTINKTLTFYGGKKCQSDIAYSATREFQRTFFTNKSGKSRYYQLR
jgi:hypothetical protein